MIWRVAPLLSSFLRDLRVHSIFFSADITSDANDLRQQSLKAL